MKGAEIIVTSAPRGIFLEGTIDDTSKPGTVMEITPLAAFAGGRPHWRHYQPSADADPRMMAVLLPDFEQGKTCFDAYVSGTRCFLYVPLAGEEINMLVAPQAGTGSADAYTIGERLTVQHTTGQLIAESTSSIAAQFQSMEHIDLASQTAGLVWCMRTGN